MTKHDGKRAMRRKSREMNPHSLYKCIRHPKIVRPKGNEPKLRTVKGTQKMMLAVRNTGVEGIVEHRFYDCCCYGCITHCTPCTQKDYADEWTAASVTHHRKTFLRTFKHNFFPPICSIEPEPVTNNVSKILMKNNDSGTSSDETTTSVEISDIEPLRNSSDGEEVEEIIDTSDDSSAIQVIGVDEYNSSEYSCDEFCATDNYVIPVPNDTIPNYDASVDYDWENVLDIFNMLDSYECLRGFVRETSLPQVLCRMKYYIDAGDAISEVGLHFWPQDSPAGYKPVTTVGDGNCLCHALAYALFGDQHRDYEVRVRITFAAVLKEDDFLHHSILARGSQNGSENRPRNYALYSGQLPERRDLDLLNEDDVRQIYRNDVMANRKKGNYMGIWQFHQAAEVFKRPVASIYPRHTNKQIRRDLHRLILPINSGHDNKIPVHIMWTPLHLTSNHFDVKHFLTLFMEKK